MELIKKLRDKTQVGMMDCKKALVDSDGDFDKAVEVLRKKGASVAAKRAEQATNNGRIASYTSPDYSLASLLEISCETDFSANTAAMKEFAQEVAEQAAKVEECCDTTCEVSCLLKQSFHNDPKMTVQDKLDELLAKISENIKISKTSRFKAADGSLVNVYIHPGSTLGVMIELATPGLDDSKRETVAKLAKDLCMQIAVTNPLAISTEGLDQELVEKERAFFKEQLIASGKPEQIIEKIMSGKMNKFYSEVCLTKQGFIKEDKISVEQHMNNVAKDTGCTISITRFKRFSIGK